MAHILVTENLCDLEFIEHRVTSIDRFRQFIAQWPVERAAEVCGVPADDIRQAVSNGYEQGYHAGRADRDDDWRSDYEDCFAYQDANYGYSGFYVDRDDYRYFFREGFRRGYEDGYGGRHVYGSASDGKIAILAAVVAGIIGHELIQ